MIANFLRSFLVVLFIVSISLPAHAGIVNWFKATRDALQKALQSGRPGQEQVKDAEIMATSGAFVEYGCWDSDGEGAAGPHKTAGQVLYKTYLGKDEKGNFKFKSNVGKDFCKGEFIGEYSCEKYGADPNFWITAKGEPFTTKPCPLWTGCVDASCRPVCVDSDGDDYEKKGEVTKYYYKNYEVKAGSPIEDKCSQQEGWLIEQICTGETGEISTKQVNCAEYEPGYICNDGRCIPCGGLDTDGDGIGNNCDNCPSIVSENLNDSDGDGIGDACDNCIYVPNPDQTKSIAGPFGDACNCDENGDGIITEAFTDNDFLMVIREILGKGPEENIAIQDVKDIKELKIVKSKIKHPGEFKDISGVQCFANLEKFVIAMYHINNIEPLSELPGLLFVQVAYVNSADLGPLKGLLKLKTLNFAYDGSGWDLIDISPLSGLNEIEGLNLGGQNLTNVDTLVKLKNIKYLHLNGTNISDLTPIKNLTKLEELEIYNTKANDLSPLSGFAKLYRLEAGWLGITDLTFIKGLKNIQYLSLEKNKISDIGPLEELNYIWELHLDDNNIADITPLCPILSHTNKLVLKKNKIEDLTPLTDCVVLSWFSLDISNNPLKEPYLEPLTKNPYWGKPGELHLSSDQLNDTVKKQVEKLKAKGVSVYVDDKEI